MVVLLFAIALLHSLRACFRSQCDQALVELALRQQLAVYAHARRRPRLTTLDRAFWVLLRQLWPRWRQVLVVVQPETVVPWHRQGFRLYWRFRSRRRPGRPRIPKDLRRLIQRMARENPWGARKIHAELAKLGIEVSVATVSRYLPKRPPDPARRQNWLTFLRNHKDAIAAMDFLVVPTVRFQLLYVWFVLNHDRRRLIHFGVTTSPSARWLMQQLREAFPSDNALPFLLYDRDSIFSAEVTATIRNLGIEPVRTAYRSPWQNPFAEREGDRPPSRGQPPPSVRMVRSSLTPWPPAHRSHAMSSEDRQAASAAVADGTGSYSITPHATRAPPPPRGLGASE
jgi:hypothetical protein